MRAPGPSPRTTIAPRSGFSPQARVTDALRLEVEFWCATRREALWGPRAGEFAAGAQAAAHPIREAAFGTRIAKRMRGKCVVEVGPVAQGEERVATLPSPRRRRPADGDKRSVYLNAVLWRAIGVAAGREYRTRSGWIAVLCERALGWDDES